MAAAPLTSNHVNYLIWRYLQESGHDKTAARLQRDWKIGDPETLPFARHIRTHALVSLVQKGLQYHELESSLQQSGDRATQTPTTLFFGTDSADAAPLRDTNDAETAVKAPASPRKHARDSIAAAGGPNSAVHAPAAKRQRRNARDAAVAKSGDEMDVDQQHEFPQDVANLTGSDAAASESLLPNGKQEYHQDSVSGLSPPDAQSTSAVPLPPSPSPAPPHTLEIGQSVPTQTDGVLEVGRDVTQVLQTEPSKEALLTAWNPHQPNLLVSGGDGLCRLYRWPVHPVDAPATNGSTHASAAPQTHDLFQSMHDASITALAWSPDGQQFAVARHMVEAPTASALSLFESDGTLVGEFFQSQQFFLGLAYSPSGSFLLAYGGVNAHYQDETRDWCLCVWDMGKEIDTPLAMRTASKQEIAGATWIGDDTIVVCGPGFIAETKLVDGKLQEWNPILPEIAKGLDSRAYDWYMITSDKYSGTCVLSAGDQGLLAILSQDRRSLALREAHSKLITGLQYQPLPQHGSTGQGPRLVASASKDGTVKLWDAADGLSLIKVFQCDTLQPETQPALGMQFSPDGSTLAAASFNKVVFWRPDKNGAWPSAAWELSTGLGWRSLGAPSVTDAGSEVNTNGVVNGINGHATVNGVNGTIVNEGVQADRMSIDGEEGRPAFRDDDEESPATTLLWSAMGKKIAFGSRNQIAVADFARAHLS